MTENLLRHEASPYLLQHKDNPVHWRPWGRDALDEASREQKPILLSVGYAACHWCHVMAHESFEDPDIAALMNRLFVNIKVDREERPDVDQIYMAALHELGEQGGWPLTMFLTPDGSPIWGGTYFPPTTRYGRPGFPSVLKEVARVFHEEPDKIAHNRSQLLERLSQPPPSGTIAPDRALLDHAAERLLSLMDRERGGTNGAPKFPQASLLELFWRAGERTGKPDYTGIVVTTLRNICSGGIYDHIGGGFARYSVDRRWLVPHFEKMLYDNAQLIELLALAHVETGDPLFAARVEETIAWLEREMIAEEGAYAASLDADSDGHEGRFYVWSLDEIIETLGAAEGAFFASAYDITPEGNWEGTSIPNRLGGQLLLDEKSELRLATARATLLERRETRPRPARDDKVLADWNGLAIAAIATAGMLLKRTDWLDISIRTYRRVLGLMENGGRLSHSYRAGKRVFPGLATDHAAMIKAALALHAATFETGYLDDAGRFAGALRAHHWDAGNPGYFLSADDADALIVRPRSNVDEATPSANALMGTNLVRLWRLTGDDVYRDDVDAMVASSSGAIAQNLFASAGTLNALDSRLRATDIVVLRPAGADAGPMLDAVRRRWSPTMALSLHDDAADFADHHPAAGKGSVEGKVTVYVCRGATCSLPVTTPEALATLLAAGENGAIVSVAE